ncbi:MAG: NUMOD4 domain-containing protein [Bacteroidia bacterium]
MTNTLKNEEWKEIRIEAKKQRTRYGVSNTGRVCSFKESLKEYKVLKGTLVNGYPALKIKVGAKDYQFYIHKLVAGHFVSKGGRGKDFVIHLDYNKLNNKAKNLRWASKEEMEKHQQGSPGVKSYRERTRTKGHKLTANRVRRIKQMINAKDRRQRMRDIADYFGISEMQLYRIKSGENWGHVR